VDLQVGRRDLESGLSEARAARLFGAVVEGDKFVWPSRRPVPSPF